MLQQRKPENTEPTCRDGARSALLLVYQVFGFVFFVFYTFFQEKPARTSPRDLRPPASLRPSEVVCAVRRKKPGSFTGENTSDITGNKYTSGFVWETIFTQYHTEDVTLTYI